MKLTAIFRICRNAARNRLHCRRPSNWKRGFHISESQLVGFAEAGVNQDVGGIQIDVFQQYDSTICRFAREDEYNLNNYQTPRQLGLRHGDIMNLHYQVHALFLLVLDVVSVNIDFFLPGVAYDQLQDPGRYSPLVYNVPACTN